MMSLDSQLIMVSFWLMKSSKVRKQIMTLVSTQAVSLLLRLQELLHQFYDVNVGSIPRGGVIAQVGSTEGFGYQPLIGAGGTAVISGFGTVLSVSIGNSGSGYRSGIQTVNVGVGTSGAAGFPILFLLEQRQLQVVIL